MTTTIRVHTTNHPIMDFQINMAQAVAVYVALIAFAPRAAAILVIALLYCICSNREVSVGGSQPSTNLDKIPNSKPFVKLEPGRESEPPEVSRITNEVRPPELVVKPPLCLPSPSVIDR